MSMVTDRFEIKTHRDAWWVFDNSTALYAAFNGHRIAMDAKRQLNAGHLKIDTLRWFTWAKMTGCQ